MAKFNRNEISKERESENSGGALLSRPSGSEKKEGTIIVRLPKAMELKYKAILNRIGSNPSVKTRELIYEYVDKYENK